MNHVQLKLEEFKKAAHAARLDPAGKPFKAACALIEQLEATLRSVQHLAPRQEYADIAKLVGAVLDGKAPQLDPVPEKAKAPKKRKGKREQVDGASALEQDEEGVPTRAYADQ